MSDRRTFITTMIGSGFALAVLPVRADSRIETPSEGLKISRSTFKSGSTIVPLYAARPENAASPPIVLVVSEIFGVHEYIADVCRRLALAGYFAVAPDLFVRYGDPRKEDNMKAIIENIISKVPDDEVFADLDQTVRWAQLQGGDAKHLGIMGFCWGGRITWLYAAHNPTCKAAVAWYGRLKGVNNTRMPRYPLDIASSVKVPVLGIYGGKDEGIPASDVEEMEKTLSKGTSRSKIILYPDAGHGFHADYRPSYREEDAKDGWQQALKWLQERLL